MERNSIPVNFRHAGMTYAGWATPIAEPGAGSDEQITTWHVVLNQLYFGYMTLQQDHWTVSTQWPQDLIEIVGKELEKITTNELAA